jgi:hypothetical protein
MALAAGTEEGDEDARTRLKAVEQLFAGSNRPCREATGPRETASRPMSQVASPSTFASKGARVLRRPLVVGIRAAGKAPGVFAAA